MCDSVDGLAAQATAGSMGGSGTGLCCVGHAWPSGTGSLHPPPLPHTLPLHHHQATAQPAKLLACRPQSPGGHPAISCWSVLQCAQATAHLHCIDWSLL